MERLEVEDEEQRQRRILNHLEKLSTPSSTKPSAPPLAFDFGDRATYPVAPPTELLSRVQAFLPQIEASNALLAQRAETDPESVNIEHIDESTEQYVEMNLGLGVFEDRTHKRDSLNSLHKQDTNTSASSDSDSSSADENKNDSDSSDAETETSSEIITSFCPAPRPIKPLPRRTVGRPKIQVLTEKISETDQNMR